MLLNCLRSRKLPSFLETGEAPIIAIYTRENKKKDISFQARVERLCVHTNEGLMGDDDVRRKKISFIQVVIADVRKNPLRDVKLDGTKKG
jgi:hypothetical protein